LLDRIAAKLSYRLMLRRFLLVMRAMPLINFRFIVNLIRRLSIESGMGPGLIIVRQPCADILSVLLHASLEQGRLNI
jgi:hypothetical protein